MTTATMTLTEFLLARIAEDEAAAGNWLRFEVRDGIPGNYAIKARVLAECEAKRRVVELHYSDHGIEPWDPTCHEDGYGLQSPDECPTLRAIAAIYADQPDYRDEWRP